MRARVRVWGHVRSIFVFEFGFVIAFESAFKVRFEFAIVFAIVFNLGLAIASLSSYFTVNEASGTMDQRI